MSAPNRHLENRPAGEPGASASPSPEAAGPAGRDTFTGGPWQRMNDFDEEGRLTIIANVDGEIIDGVHHYTYDVIARCMDEFGEALPNALQNANAIAAAPDAIAFVRQITAELGSMEWATTQHAELLLRNLIEKYHSKGRAITKAAGES